MKRQNLKWEINTENKYLYEEQTHKIFNRPRYRETKMRFSVMTLRMSEILWKFLDFIGNLCTLFMGIISKKNDFTTTHIIFYSIAYLFL